MTVKQARKLLGKEAEGNTDEEIQKDIEVVEFFKDMFFGILKEKQVKFEQ